MEISIPIKEINGEQWLSLMNLAPKFKIRSIGMDSKPKRIQDEGKHHCFEINAEGNVRLKPKYWNL